MACRFYFPETEAGAVAPTIDTAAGQWDSGHTGSQLNRRLLFTPDASTLTSTAYTPDGSDHAGDTNTHHRQYVSDSLPAQTIPASTWKCQFQGLQPNAGCNQRLTIKIYVVSQDGGTVRGILSAISRDGDNEWATSLTNRAHSGTIAELAILANDRLVVEVGTGGSPGSGSGTQGHNATIRFGGNASTGDLPEDDASALTTRRPWIELSALITNAAAQAEALPLAVVETTPLDVTTGPAETLPVDVSELVAGAGTALVGEAVAVDLGESATAEDQTAPPDPIAGDDAIAVALAEDLLDDRDLASPLVTGLTEESAGAGTATQAEVLPFPLAGETSVVVDVTPSTPVDVAETLPMPLQEAQASLGAADQAETLATPLVEALASLLGALGRVDSLPVTLPEATSLQVTLPGGDTVGIRLVEVESLLAALLGTETLPVGLSEAELLEGLAVLQGTETLPIGLADGSFLLGFLSVGEAVAAVLLEPTEADVELTGLLDLLPVTLVDALGIDVLAPGQEDALPVGLTDAAAVSGIAFVPATDSTALQLTEDQVLAIFNVVLVADSLGLPVSTVQALAATLLLAESLGMPLSEAVASLGTGTVAESMGVSVETLEVLLGALVLADATALDLVELTAAFTVLADVDPIAVALLEAPPALAALWITLGDDTLPISLEELSVILTSITAVRRIGPTGVDALAWTTTVDAVIRSWEVEMASPFPYTVVPA